MKKFMLIATIVLAGFVATPSVHASDWFGGNNGEWKMGPHGPYWDESDWPEWTPMYWMEEFMDSWDDNNWGGNNWGSNFGGYNNGYGYPNRGYGYGNQYQMPYGYTVPNGGYYYPQVPTQPTVPTK